MDRPRAHESGRERFGRLLKASWKTVRGAGPAFARQGGLRKVGTVLPRDPLRYGNDHVLRAWSWDGELSRDTMQIGELLDRNAIALRISAGSKRQALAVVAEIAARNF